MKKVIDRGKRSKTLITASTSIHLPKPVSFLVLTNPLGKDGVQGWLM